MILINNDGLIERVVRNKISISELSRILDVSRTSIYNWFQQKQIGIDVVCKIGKVIDHDFGNEFPEAFAKEGDRIMADLTKERMEDEHYYSDSVQYWMKKYIILLEKHNDLLHDIHSKPGKTPVVPGAMLGTSRNTRLYYPKAGY
ncbi:hypothetical protein OQX61_13105 [Pedobacter sp. PLR]|uniref:hypothetical protein n=1 Tax=Pedobacter sp. PLR TaxID=2994465 RepID=UPI00224530BA|nr:hypothetical protein [Pedobacter sp. PLR]MCX2452205.1 hypothetical protein [Pedobacter sp. PLR]